MSEIVEGLGGSERNRIAALRGQGRYFWIDLCLAEVPRDELVEALDVPPHALEVNVLVHGDYLLTVHRERVSLPEQLPGYSAEGRSEQYIVYAVLDAMVATAFDALNDTELALEGLQVLAGNAGDARMRMGTLRAISVRLNKTMYWLTVVATIFLPLTFLTGFFGMNFAWMVGRIDTPAAFFALGLGGPALGTALIWLAVRRRGTPVQPDQDAVERLVATLRRPLR